MKHFLPGLLLAALFSCLPKEKAATTAASESDSLALPTQTITLLFAGDLMQHQAQIDAARTPGGGYDYTEGFRYVKDEISRADIAIGNLEVTLAGKPYKGYPAFSAPDEFLTAIKESGFDILLTANNHCLDRGQKGLERTILMLDSLQIPYAGTYTNPAERQKRYPLLIEEKGFRIALLNYTYGTNGLEPKADNVVNYIEEEIMLQDIVDAKAMQPDVIIACMHWGDEYKLLPNKEQKDLANLLIANGVHHVIGSHPHVVQPLELRTDSVTGQQNVVVYSLSNLISNMSKRNTDGGLLFRMTLAKEDNTVTLKHCDYSLVWVSRPTLSPKRKIHTLLPITFPQDSLSAEERRLMKVFVDDSRKLFKEHNLNIEEYAFQP